MSDHVSTYQAMSVNAPFPDVRAQGQGLNFGKPKPPKAQPSLRLQVLARPAIHYTVLPYHNGSMIQRTLTEKLLSINRLDLDRRDLFRISENLTRVESWGSERVGKWDKWDEVTSDANARVHEA